MNRGPSLFLGAFLALSISWFSMILVPQLQIGGQNPTEASDLGIRYPSPRPGEAQEGLQVYRANGCVYCHSQQVGQSGIEFDLRLTKSGIFTEDVANEILRISPNGFTSLAVKAGVANTNGFTFLRSVTKEQADYAKNRLLKVGGGIDLAVIPYPMGGDIRLGWGVRRSVSRDYLYDYPVQLGSQRLGPDLASVGARRPDAEWHFKHLYSPRSTTPGSKMPRYEFLFEVRKAGEERNPEALDFTNEAATGNVDGSCLPEEGYEVVPTEDAKRLVAYMLSLQNGPRLFETPMPKAEKPASAQAPEEQAEASVASAQ